MHNVNWCLMALAFALGLLLTLALMIRRVKREVPEHAGAAAAKLGDTSTADTAKIAAVTEEPYGPGSARVAGGAAELSGYDVKGNEDSMLYHTPQSPSYKRTVAEVWFRDVETAEKAGFSRWDSGKSQRGQT